MSYAAKASAQQTTSALDASATAVPEVVVTAQKKTERLVDVPLSVSVVTGDKLISTQSTSLQDIANRIAGLQLVASTETSNQLVIRGISTGANAINSGVATYVDETPYTSVGPFAGSAANAPNLDPYDIARVEVLRGPQGTLYGANALAGLLKYVTNPPDPSGYSASFLVGGSSVEHGGAGYELHGMANIPLGANAALRIVGNDTKFPGYIDDPGRGDSDINTVDRSGLRASLLWAPTPDVSIRLNADYQRLRAADTGTEDLLRGSLNPVFGDLEQERVIPQPLSMISEVYNGTVDWDLKFATLVSATSYVEMRPNDVVDGTNAYGPVLTSIFDESLGAVVTITEPVKSFTQEIRLTSEQHRKFDWLVGGYYNNESADEHEAIYPIDLGTGQILTNFQPALGAYHITSTYVEYAAFSSATYHVTPAMEIGLGGRYSENQQTYHQISAGLLTGSTNFTTPSRQDVFTYSADVKYRFGGAANLYARLATGFVPGGPNDAIPESTLPSTFHSSTTTNVEVGLKGQSADGRLSYDLDLFNVDWRDIQLEVVINDLVGISNGGTARSQGAEGNLDYSPVRGLDLALNAAYTDARLTQDTPASVGGHAGDRLPYSPYFASTASATYERPISPKVSGFAGLDWHYSGDRLSEFLPTSPRQQLPSYNLVNLRIGAKYSHYVLTAYVKNVGNTRAISTVFPETIHGLAAESAFVQTPRTVGMTLAATF